MICRHDERLRERTLEIADLLGSIKVIGPKRSDDEVLMELPDRGTLQQMVIQRVKAQWSNSTKSLESKYAIKREHLQFSKNNLQSIKSEIVEQVSEDDR